MGPGSMPPPIVVPLTAAVKAARCCCDAASSWLRTFLTSVLVVAAMLFFRSAMSRFSRVTPTFAASVREISPYAFQVVWSFWRAGSA